MIKGWSVRPPENTDDIELHDRDGVRVLAEPFHRRQPHAVQLDRSDGFDRFTERIAAASFDLDEYRGAGGGTAYQINFAVPAAPVPVEHRISMCTKIIRCGLFPAPAKRNTCTDDILHK